MCMRSLLSLVVLAALPACGFAGLVDEKFDTPVGESMTTGEHDLAMQVFGLVNAERARRELPPLIWDETAADVGYDHCVDMRVRGFYAHTNPDGLTARDRMEAAGVDMTVFAAENLTRHDESTMEAFSAWMASPSHREAILSPMVTHLGVGVHTGSGGPWWAQEFFLKVD